MSNDPAERAAERIADDISEDNEREAWIAEAADIIRAEYSELMPCGHPRACVRKHERVIHSICYEVNCNICDGGLFICKHCNKAEVELDTPCNCTACEREAAAVEAAREELARKLDISANPAYWDVAERIRALNATGALDRKVNEARLAEAEWWYQHTNEHQGCVACPQRIAELKAVGAW